jgi:hypothetical protein
MRRADADKDGTGAAQVFKGNYVHQGMSGNTFPGLKAAPL